MKVKLTKDNFTGATDSFNGAPVVKVEKEYFYADDNGVLRPTADTIKRRKRAAELEEEDDDDIVPQTKAQTYNYAGSSWEETPLEKFIADFGFPLLAITTITLGIQWGCLSAIMYSWPRFLSTLFKNYQKGTIDFAVILITGLVVASAVIFVMFFLSTFRKKKSQVKKFVIVFTVFYTGVMTLIQFLSGSLGIIGNIFSGLILSILPAFLLYFAEHLATKKLRNDNRSFLSKVSVTISRLYIGSYVGMFALGALWAAFGGIMKFVGSLEFTAQNFGQSMQNGFVSTGTTALVLGLTNIIMAILAFKHRKY